MSTKITTNGYIGSPSDPDSVLQKLLDLGGHNNLHLKCDNPNKIYYLLPNKTISSMWMTDEQVHVRLLSKEPFSLYVVNGISFCAYNYNQDTVWNPGMGFVHIPQGACVDKLPAPDDMVKNLLSLAGALGYVYNKKAGVWKFKVTPKAPCYYKQSMVDLFWNVGVFLGYDEHGYAMIDNGSDSTLVCRAEHCVPYKNFSTLVDVTGQINDRLVNIHLI